MHTKQFYRLRNVCAGHVLYRALVILVFISSSPSLPIINSTNIDSTNLAHFNMLITIRPWLECRHRHLNIRIKELATKPAKKLKKFFESRDQAGFEPMITAPPDQALVRSASRLAAAGYRFLPNLYTLNS